MPKPLCLSVLWFAGTSYNSNGTESGMVALKNVHSPCRQRLTQLIKFNQDEASIKVNLGAELAGWLSNMRMAGWQERQVDTQTFTVSSTIASTFIGCSLLVDKRNVKHKCDLEKRN